MFERQTNSNTSKQPGGNRTIQHNKMKTQINTLVKGDHRKGIVGTKSEIRNEIAKQVKIENPENMTISIRDTVIELSANWSISRKTVTYFSPISLELYREFFGDFGLPKENPSAFISINTDMSVWISSNSKKTMYQIIPEKEITIL